MKDDFLLAPEHFARLVAKLPRDERDLFEELRHVRIETAFKDRHFVVYRMDDHGHPIVIDRLVIGDFECDDIEGASTAVWSTELKQGAIIGYTPELLWDYDAFMFMPLHGKIRWASSDPDSGKCSLGYPIGIKTRSRLNLREPGVTYIETLKSFGDEFKLLPLAA